MTRRTSDLDAIVQLFLSAALTGLPFLLLLATSGPLMVAVIVVLTTVGDMLWLPLSQSITADLAPAEQRGAYQGAFDGATSLAFAVGPMAALELSAVAGNPPVWVTFAVVALVAAVIGVRPIRVKDRAG